MVKVSIKLGVCLSRLFGTCLSLKRLVVFMDMYFMTHVPSMLGHSILLFVVTCVIFLPIMLVHGLTMHTMLLLIRLYV